MTLNVQMMSMMIVMVVVVVLVATKGGIELNVFSKAQWGAWYSQNVQRSNFVIVEGMGRRHTDTFTASGWS
jgi:hypothetical protein